MPTTIRNTDILFNDGSTQSTAATAQSTTFGAVGTYAVLMMGVSTNLAIDGTIAGSSLRYNFTPNISADSGVGAYANFASARTATSASYNGGGTSLSGTWRKVSTGLTYTTFTDCGLTYYYWCLALYVRIS